MLVFSVLGYSSAAWALTFEVDRTEDSADASKQVCNHLDDDDCSLRGAIIRANADPDPDTILLPASAIPYMLSIARDGEPSNAGGKEPAKGDFDVLNPLTIIGAGPEVTTVQLDPALTGNDADRLFHVPQQAGSFSISGVTLTGGVAGFRGGAIWGFGGANLTVSNCRFEGNSGGDGGAISFDSTGVVTIRDALFTDNSTFGRGGGLFFESGTGTLTNVTFSGNSAGGPGGGAVDVSTSTLRISHATFVGNSASDVDGVGGAIRNEDNTEVRNSVFSNNIAAGVPENCGGSTAVTSAGHNIADEGSCGFSETGDLVTASTIVEATLADNGGATETHDLAAASPALDVIPATACTDPDDIALTRDQRGFDRPSESDGSADFCDAGAVEAGCGDGRVQATEQCDDGNNDNSDDCTDVCSNAACGDGFVQGTEECDDGGTVAGDGCSATCTDEGVPACGDGILQAGEECDDAGGNDDGAANACRTDCRLAYCGDDTVDDGETCDDGGGNSDTTADACRSNCVEASCGDGQADTGEACDDGNPYSTDDCLEGCLAAQCPDGIVWAGVEECDDGNNDNTDDCTDLCLEAVCGDGFIQGGEGCDDGPGNSDSTADACREDCTPARCGDDVLDTVEACDDGNSTPNDDCTWPSCAIAHCGDGIVHVGVEDCDDGNNDSTDDCVESCVNAACGDGFVHGDDEYCDDGNARVCDGCGNCEKTVDLTNPFNHIVWFPECGDDVVNHECEECDDGNHIGGDGCSFQCFLEDTDGDGVNDDGDNCANEANADQANFDKDAFGDACDLDDDNDRVRDVVETNTGLFLSASDVGTNPRSLDSDFDGAGDHAELRAGTSPADRLQVPAPAALDKSDRGCVAGMHKSAAKMEVTQGKVSERCLNDANRDRLQGTADECLLDDPKGKLTRGQGLTVRFEAKRCYDAFPPFGRSGALTVNAATTSEPVALLRDIFGADVDLAVLVDRDGFACQSAVLKGYGKVARQRTKEFMDCAGKAMKAGADGPGMLENCVGVDPKGRVARGIVKLRDTLSKRCEFVGISDAFPGVCASDHFFSDCVGVRVACRNCLMLNRVAGLAAACDLLDDASANGSCVP